MFSRAYIMNWLVNMTGRPGGFKELDLLQEHMNFWAKVIVVLAPACPKLSQTQIIYAARGANRSWEWLATASVCIQTLRQVIRNFKEHYQTSHNSTSHTSPSLNDDIARVSAYMKDEKIQEFKASRAGKVPSYEPRDLIASGIAALNDAKTFNGFRDPYRKGTRKAPKLAARAAGQNRSDPEEAAEDDQPDDGESDEDEAPIPDLVDDAVETTLDDLDADEDFPDVFDLIARYVSSDE
jgi:hypothetical protein